MPGDKTRDLRKVNRRSFVKTLSAMGVSATSLKYLSKDALAEVTDAPSERVPVMQFLKTPTGEEDSDEFDDPIGRVPVYEAVDRDIWMRIEAIHNAADKIQSELACDGIAGVTAGVRTRINGQHEEPVISVRHRKIKRRTGENSHRVKQEPNVDFSELRGLVPDHANGNAGRGEYKHEVEDIPVLVERKTTIEQDYYDDEYRPVPAGCAIDSDESDVGQQGTLGTPVHDPNSTNDKWVTAAHVIDPDASRGDSVTSAVVHQPHEDDGVIGNSEKWWYPDYDVLDDCGDYDGDGPADAALVDSNFDIDSEFDFASDSTWSDYMGWEIKGRVTWDRIKLNADSSYDLEHNLQGKTSGRISGEIICADKPMYEIDVNSDYGDSGGPYFEISDDDGFIGGIHRGIGSETDVAEGTAMEFVENELGVYVGNTNI